MIQFKTLSAEKGFLSHIHSISVLRLETKKELKWRNSWRRSRSLSSRKRSVCLIRMAMVYLLRRLLLLLLLFFFFSLICSFKLFSFLIISPVFGLCFHCLFSSHVMVYWKWIYRVFSFACGNLWNEVHDLIFCLHLTFTPFYFCLSKGKGSLKGNEENGIFSWLIYFYGRVSCSLSFGGNWLGLLVKLIGAVKYTCCCT